MESESQLGEEPSVGGVCQSGAIPTTVDSMPAVSSTGNITEELLALVRELALKTTETAGGGSSATCPRCGATSGGIGQDSRAVPGQSTPYSSPATSSEIGGSAFDVSDLFSKGASLLGGGGGGEASTGGSFLDTILGFGEELIPDLFALL